MLTLALTLTLTLTLKLTLTLTLTMTLTLTLMLTLTPFVFPSPHLVPTSLPPSFRRAHLSPLSLSGFLMALLAPSLSRCRSADNVTDPALSLSLSLSLSLAGGRTW
jgi:hypothetical protein